MTPVQVSRLMADTMPSRMESFHPTIQWLLWYPSMPLTVAGAARDSHPVPFTGVFLKEQYFTWKAH